MPKKLNIYDLRVLTTFITCLVCLAAIIALRPQREFGLIETKFAAAKIAPRASIDVVAVGDSRVLHSIAPESFKTDSSDLQVHNFGFQGASLSHDILESAVTLLSQEGQRVLICGVTPNTFTPDANATNGYNKFKKLLKKRSVFRVSPTSFDNFARRLEPVAMRDLAKFARGDFKSGVYKTFHDNGWVETWVEGKQNPLSALPLYERRFVNNLPDEKNIASFLEFVEEATKLGVTVTGFQPPVPEEMKQLEFEKSGFAYDKFVPRFEAMGGVWISPDASTIATYDGSHLDRESAREYSKRVATTLDKLLRSSQDASAKTKTPQLGKTD